MANPTSSYREAQMRSLANPVRAVHYLNGVLQDYPEGFLKALRKVAQARQMSKVAQTAGVKREALYRALSDQGNPTYETLVSVLGVLGLRLAVTSVKEEENDTHSACQAVTTPSRLIPTLSTMAAAQPTPDKE